MYRLLAVVMMLCLAGSAFAVDLGQHQKDVKSDVHVLQNPGTPDGREGGETTATAVPITSIPFTDTGNTCDNIHDYDEVCPYSGSTAPDVVYVYAPNTDCFATIDLCLSSYDTKVYVYDGHMGLVGCNDDAYFGDPPECFTYSSALDVLLEGGRTYYIVVDGYSGDCGDYQIDVTCSEPCVVNCGPETYGEGEPALYDGYNDVYNGGCNSTPPTFQYYNFVNEGMGDCGLVCANAGNFVGATGYDTRDTDWYEVVAAAPTLTVTYESEYELLIYLLDASDCNNIVLLDGPYYSEPCVPLTINYAVTLGQTYTLFAAPTVFAGTPMNWTYTMQVCGHLWDVVPVEPSTWGGVKDLYR